VRLVARYSSSSFALQREDVTGAAPNFDIVISVHAALCEMNRMTIVPANEFFELDELAVFRDLA